MMIKFLARGTGSAAADYLSREQNLSPEQKQDQDQDPEPEKNPEEVKVLRGNPHQVQLHRCDGAHREISCGFTRRSGRPSDAPTLQTAKTPSAPSQPRPVRR